VQLLTLATGAPPAHQGLWWIALCLTRPCCTTDDNDERLPLLKEVGHHLVAVNVLGAQALGCNKLQQDPLQLLLLSVAGQGKPGKDEE
jgi:hypothetical protein